MNLIAPLDCTPSLPIIAPCEHIAGNEKFILKAFDLQTQHLTSNGLSSVDVTLDLEDGAPVGNEEALRQLFVKLLLSPENRAKQSGVRIHSADSKHCVRDLEVLITKAAHAIRYITIPKVQSVRDALWVQGLIRHFSQQAGHTGFIPLHLLIETNQALSSLQELASLPGVETLDFGLMDFISQLGGGVPATCMRTPGQFENHLVASVKSSIALAALGNNAIPCHNVTVDVRNPELAYTDALTARTDYGYLRMWSIHPDQIDPIIRAMRPSEDEVTAAHEIIARAQAAHWGPIEHEGRLHDRASYRYYWGILSRSGKAT